MTLKTIDKDLESVTSCINLGTNPVIQTNTNFHKSGYIGVYNSNFTGNFTSDFITAVGNNHGNNSGFP